ncbi:MAG: hypothetical protein AAFR89_08240, partial [Cyanobacteria bacterium J06633_1]
MTGIFISPSAGEQFTEAEKNLILALITPQKITSLNFITSGIDFIFADWVSNDSEFNIYYREKGLTSWNTVNLF